MGLNELLFREFELRYSVMHIRAWSGTVFCERYFSFCQPFWEMASGGILPDSLLSLTSCDFLDRADLPFPSLHAEAAGETTYCW